MPSSFPAGTLQTPRGAGARRPGVGGSLLGVHLRPRQPPLDEVQRRLHHRVVVGGTGARLVRGHDQRQRLLPDVHRRPAAPPDHRSAWVVQLFCRHCLLLFANESVLMIGHRGKFTHCHLLPASQTTRTTRRARCSEVWTPCRRSSGATSTKTTAGSSRSSANGRSSSARPQLHRVSPRPPERPRTRTQTTHSSLRWSRRPSLGRPPTSLSRPELLQKLSQEQRRSRRTSPQRSIKVGVERNICHTCTDVCLEW